MLIGHSKSAPSLFSPVKIRHLTLKNRLFLPAITTFYNEDEVFSERDIRFYQARARGGIGLIVTGMLTVVSYRGYHLRFPGMYHERFVPQAQKLVAAVKQYDTPILAQLGVYYQWRAAENEPLEVFGPSAVLPIHGKEMPRAMTLNEIKKFISDFGEAARLSTRAGFDGVELVTCQGNVLNRFISTLTNKRTDEYGGSVANRLRLIVEILQACREAGGDRFIIGCRLSVDELMPGGMTIKDYLPICAELEKAGVDYLSVEVGWHESSILHLHGTVPAGRWSYLAGEVKKAVATPVMTAQRIDNIPLAESVIARGEADMVGMARSLIADPELPAKAQAGNAEGIRPCIVCMRCQEGADTVQPMSCSVNPVVGDELEPIRKSAKPRRVLVIGGGPAGIAAAVTAAARGNEVELMEAKVELGGYLVEAAIPPGKSRLNGYIAYLRREIASSPVKVTLGKQATLKTIEEIDPEVVVLATGSSPARPPIEGLGLANVLDAVDILRHPGKCRGEVVIIGGGLIGLETALFLNELGRRVTVLEMLGRVGVDMGYQTRFEVLQRIKKAGIRVETGTKAVRFTEKAVEAVKGSERVTFPAESIVLAAGLQPNDSLQKEIPAGKWEVYSVGDCVSPQKILEAVRDGYRAGLNI